MTRILLVGTSEEANAILGGYYPQGSGVPGSEDGTGGSQGTLGSFLERYLRAMLSAPVIVSTYAVAGSTWATWVATHAAAAIAYANGLAGGSVTKILVAIGENESGAPSVLADAQTVINALRAGIPTSDRIMVTPPILGIADTVNSSAVNQIIINHWREVAVGLTGVTIVDPYYLDDFSTRQAQLQGGDGLHIGYLGAKNWGARKAKAIAQVLDGSATGSVVKRSGGVSGRGLVRALRSRR